MTDLIIDQPPQSSFTDDPIICLPFAKAEHTAYQFRPTTTAWLIKSPVDAGVWRPPPSNNGAASTWRLVLHLASYLKGKLSKMFANYKDILREVMVTVFSKLILRAP